MMMKEKTFMKERQLGIFRMEKLSRKDTTTIIKLTVKTHFILIMAKLLKKQIINSEI